ncbi:hypothetical protein BDD43_0672 [Mucilaginibacter gracilis]|uniref:Uncharacterized protein n=1 Tax=Mucilaginibacter gracilis TaxID=423350 RepID=A0A495IW33_9SPHI|nr:hypothetical protein [Mucilaginibacter gracilis]RKR80551.1 hypothetical protein BDD43_0672 [Mucilaginibacter gracilis]
MKIKSTNNPGASVAFFGLEILSPMEQRAVKGGLVDDIHQDKDIDDGNAHIHQHVHVPAPQAPQQAV